MTWVMRRALVLRQTCRHAREGVSPHPDDRAHEGRALGDGEPRQPPGRWRAADRSCSSSYGIDAGLRRREDGGADERTLRSRHRARARRSATTAMEAVQRFVRAFTYENMPWREAQEAGMLWAPLRKPHENAIDPHWLKRGSVTDVEHPELGKSFRYATSKWISTAHVWSVGRRAPLLNEDADSDRAAASKRDTPVIGAERAASIRRSRRRRAASRSRCTASASSTSRGSSRPPAARGSSPRSAPRASRSS